MQIFHPKFKIKTSRKNYCISLTGEAFTDQWYVVGVLAWVPILGHSEEDRVQLWLSKLQLCLQYDCLGDGLTTEEWEYIT